MLRGLMPRLGPAFRYSSISILVSLCSTKFPISNPPLALPVLILERRRRMLSVTSCGNGGWGVMAVFKMSSLVLLTGDVSENLLDLPPCIDARFDGAVCVLARGSSGLLLLDGTEAEGTTPLRSSWGALLL